MLLEGAPAGDADPVKQLAQKLDACALDDCLGDMVKTEGTPSPSKTQLTWFLAFCVSLFQWAISQQGLRRRRVLRDMLAEALHQALATAV